jgi:hypothetical protein
MEECRTEGYFCVRAEWYCEYTRVGGRANWFYIHEMVPVHKPSPAPPILTLFHHPSLYQPEGGFTGAKEPPFLLQYSKPCCGMVFLTYGLESEVAKFIFSCSSSCDSMGGGVGERGFKGERDREEREWERGEGGKGGGWFQ